MYARLRAQYNAYIYICIFIERSDGFKGKLLGTREIYISGANRVNVNGRRTKKERKKKKRREIKSRGGQVGEGNIEEGGGAPGRILVRIRSQLVGKRDERI